MKKHNHPFINSFLEFIESKNLILPGEKILITVSGGMDSMVMADLFLKSGIQFSIAHCNFSLRGEESDNDERFVKNYALQTGVAFHQVRFDTKSYAGENKLSIQEAARELRYEWFHQLCDEFGYRRIATAHHIDDSIETFFINLMRGTGPAGLKGISVKSGRIIRPLLFTGRSAIENYLKENKIDYREDSSNADDHYLRNRIRHHLIPFLQSNAEGFSENMKYLMGEMEFIHGYLSEKMDEWKSKHVKTDSQGCIHIPLKTINKEKNSSSFLSFLLYSFGIKGVDCDKILNTKESGKYFGTGDFEILRDRENLVLQKKTSKEISSPLIRELPVSLEIDGQKIYIHEQTTVGVKTENQATNIQHIAGEELIFPLEIRNWKPGDTFMPLGMKGRKKISDYYTDIKLNRFQKDKTLLLLSGKNIVCILGHRIDDRYKILPSTKKIVTIELTI